MKDQNYFGQLNSNNEETENSEEGQLTVDVFQDDKHIYIQSAIAGINDDNLDIAIANDMVTIKGSRARPPHITPNQYFYREIVWGNFSRSVILPEAIDSDLSNAEFKNGVLTITLPKKRAIGEKKLKVRMS